MNIDAFKNLEEELRSNFDELSLIQELIIEKLKNYSDNKTLKGNEIVGCLGEIYTKIIFNGYLVNDKNEHDVETVTGLKLSVKTRKGRKSGWRHTSTIPKIEGNDSPTHLVFVNLRDDFIVNKIWQFDWKKLLENERFKKHMVRGNLRGYYFSVDEKKDKNSCIYDGENLNSKK